VAPFCAQEVPIQKTALCSVRGRKASDLRRRYGRSVAVSESFAPTKVHVATVASVLAAMGVLALVTQAPLLLKVIGGTFVALAPTYVWIALRTSITVVPDTVRVRTVRGVTDFTAGDAEVRVAATPSGLSGSAPLLTVIRLSDDRKVSVPLVSFPKRDRATLPNLVRRTLRSSHT
jgi:hypothetical protein